MGKLANKIDFALVLRVKRANPNGDPLNGNRPRADYNGYGEITDVCLKRKLRDRLQEGGHAIFVQSDDRKNDDAKSLKDRAEKALGKKLGQAETKTLACDKWMDVRAFGQLFAWQKGAKTGGAPDVAAASAQTLPTKKSKDKQKLSDSEGDPGVSIAIRGPVTIQSAFSVQPVEVTSIQITKSVSSDGDGSKRGSDTMGMKHRVDDGVYVTFGSMNPQLAERTGFSDEDAATIKSILPKLFENDASSARPEGSMEVLKVIWWKHSSKAGKYSSAKVHRSVTVSATGEVVCAPLDGLTPEILDGF